MAEDEDFTNLHVMGEWLYFSHKNSEKEICRIRIDGTDYQTLGEEWTDIINVWDTYNEKVYAVIQERMTASQFRYILAEIDWENGIYFEITQLDTEWDLIGIEDGYAYFCTRTEMEWNRDGEYQFLKVELSDGSAMEFSWLDEFEFSKFSSVGEFCLKDGNICFPYECNYGTFTDDREFYLYYANLRNQDADFKSIQIESIDDIYNFDRYVYHIVFGGDAIRECFSEFGTENLIVADYTNSICIAHDKIYYKYGKMYCEIELDGTDWKELNENEFLNGNLEYNLDFYE